MTDYYKSLGISPQADEKEIKAAYRKLAKKYHPDAIQDHPEWSDKMYEIQAAYDVLGDKEKRKKYDEKLQKGNTRKKKTEDPGGQQVNPDMSQFEQFFGFQAGKGMETYRDKRSGAAKPGGPIKPEDLFAAYFGKRK